MSNHGRRHIVGMQASSRWSDEMTMHPYSAPGALFLSLASLLMGILVGNSSAEVLPQQIDGLLNLT